VREEGDVSSNEYMRVCPNEILPLVRSISFSPSLPPSLPPSLLPLVPPANARSLGRVHIEIFKAVRTASAGRVAKSMVSSEVREEGGREGGREQFFSQLASWRK